MESFYFSPKKIARFLTCLVLGLTSASFAGQISWHVLGTTVKGFTHRFDVGKELSLPTWYSCLALVFCALLLAVIAASKRQAQAPYARHWSFLAILFVYLSIDEVVTVHETLGNALRPVLNTEGLLYYNWVIFAIPLVIVFVLSYLKFLFHLPAATRRLFFLSGGMFVGGAIGMEMGASLTYSTIGAENLIYAAFTTVEECLEMLGVVVFIYALLSYLNLQNIQGVQICLAERATAVTQPNLNSYSYGSDEAKRPEPPTPNKRHDAERNY